MACVALKSGHVWIVLTCELGYCVPCCESKKGNSLWMGIDGLGFMGHLKPGLTPRRNSEAGDVIRLAILLRIYDWNL